MPIRACVQTVTAVLRVRQMSTNVPLCRVKTEGRATMELAISRAHASLVSLDRAARRSCRQLATIHHPEEAQEETTLAAAIALEVAAAARALEAAAVAKTLVSVAAVLKEAAAVAAVAAAAAVVLLVMIHPHL